MTRRVVLTKTRWILPTCVLACVSCTAPEQSWVYQPDWDARLDEADRNEPPLPSPPVPQRGDGGAPIAIAIDPDGPVALSLEEAVVLAMRNNRDLQVQQLSPLITGLFEKIERGVYDPELFAELQFSRESASEIDRGTGAQFSVESADSRALAGVRQDLPGGTNVELSVGQNRDSSNRAPEQQDARLGLTVTQQLLRGAGPAVGLVRIRQAELDTRASRYELRGYAEALLADVESTYWRYTLALQQIAIFERSLEVARSQLDVVEKRIAVGALAEIESAAARAEVALREQGLIDAHSEVEAQRLRLLRLIDAALGGSLDRLITVTSPSEIDTEPVADLPERIRLAAAARPDLAEARLRLEQGRLETVVTRNGVLPRLEVFIALGKSGYADTFADSFRELDDESYDAAAGVRLSQVLGNDAAEARNQAAYASRRQAAAAVHNLEQLVELDVRLAANEAERARRQIDASSLTRAAQEQATQAEQQRFEAGASTSLLVAQAQRDQLAAEIAEVQSVVAYRLALIQLYLAEGSLLERRGFVIE